MGQLAHRRVPAVRAPLAILWARPPPRAHAPASPYALAKSPCTHPGSATNGLPDTKVVVHNDRGYMVALDLPR
jgi:hypothetical protein